LDKYIEINGQRLCMFEKEEKSMLSSALLNRTSFGFSAENPMGERNGGSIVR
jgi:hypothetical protein